MNREKLIQYYERCIKNNRLWWDLERSHAIHAGYWDETTHTLPEALMRENEVLAEFAKIKSSDHVLDAGCGVGGSAIFLAGRYHCKVTGIDVGGHLIQIATLNSSTTNIGDKVKFYEMDFTSTTFEGGTFDVIWALESFCHVEEKKEFFKEAWRLLRAKGRLVIADGFLSGEVNKAEKKILEREKEYFGKAYYEPIEKIVDQLRGYGYREVLIRDATRNILPSARRLYYYSFPLIVWSKAGEYLGWSTREQTQDYLGYYYQYSPLRRGLSSYLLILAEKP